MSAFSPARTARLVVGAIGALACAGAVVAAAVIGAPSFGRGPLSIDAQPPAAASVATCTGPVLASGRDVTQAGLLTDAAAQQLTVAGTGEAPAARQLAAADVPGGAGPIALTAEPADGRRADLAASGSSQVADSDLAGFAASACTRAALESWLVAGSATTGAADLVVLANPGDVPALVTLTVYGSTGETTPAAGKGIVVAAGTQRIVPVAALALGEENPVIRVSASQAPVQASLQLSLTRVLDPGGVDQVSAVGAPAPDIVIPGVRVTIAPGAAGASDVPTSLRLLAPASSGTATVTVTGPGGTVGDSRSVPLTEGVPLQVDLDGLPVGVYTVSVSATTPVTGAVWSTTGFGAASDFGWATPAPLLTSATVVAVPTGPSPQLVLSAPASAVVSVEPLTGGSPQQVSVAAGGTAVVQVAAGQSYRLTPESTGVSAAVSFAGEGAIAAFPVPAGDAAAAAITVYPR